MLTPFPGPMNPNKRKKTLNRRELLKGAAALGVTGLARRLLRGVNPPGQVAEPRPPSGPGTVTPEDLDYHTYLPFISNQWSSSHGPSKLGLHTIRPNESLPFVQGVHDAGAHVALVKALDGLGTLQAIKDVSPETVTIGRSTCVENVDPSGDPAQKATEVLAEHMDIWRYNRDFTDYWEVLNENDPPTVEGHVWLAHFFIEAMDIAEQNGYKLAIFTYPTGVPKWHEWEAIVETGVFARAKEGGHILALHEGNWPVSSHRWGEPLEDQPPYEDRGVLTGRYRYLYRDFLIPRDEVIPVAFTECGLDPVLWEPGQPTGGRQERFVEEMIWYDAKLREDDYVIGAAMFTLGPTWEWEYYDYEELLPDFHDYIVSLKDG